MMNWRARCESIAPGFQFAHEIHRCKGMYRVPTNKDACELGGGGACDAVFEEGNKLLGIAGWREAALAGADYGQGFIGGEMGESFLERSGEMELRSFGSDTEDGFAEAEDTVGDVFEG